MRCSSAQNNSWPFINFRAYCLNIWPQVHLGGHFVQTYPIAVDELLGDNFLPQTQFWWLRVYQSTSTTKSKMTECKTDPLRQLYWVHLYHVFMYTMYSMLYCLSLPWQYKIWECPNKHLYVLPFCPHIFEFLFCALVFTHNIIVSLIILCDCNQMDNKKKWVW